MKKAAWIVVVALVLVAGLAYAKWIGRYYCSYCDFDDPYATGETLAFIEGPVNQTNKDGWVDKNQNPNTVTICNGTKCATFIYVKGSVLWQFVGYFYSTWKPPAGAPGVPVGGGPLPPPRQMAAQQYLAVTSVASTSVLKWTVAGIDASGSDSWIADRETPALGC